MNYCGIKLLCFSLVVILFGCERSLYDSEFHSLRHDGKRRTYLLHIPPQSDGDTPLPLVIALHGGVGSAKNIEEQSGLAEFADEEGFVLVSPDGFKRAWNAGWCCGKASEKDIDDVGFIDALIDEVASEVPIDESRIYATGMSNGGFMCYRLACELSHRIAAIAPVAATMNYGPCAFENNVGIMHFHSYEDSNVPHEGGVGDGISDHYNSPIDSVMSAWAGFSECGSDSLDQSIEGVDHWSWTSCNDSVEIHWYMTEDGGHSWPGGRVPYDKADEPSELLSANELMWEFFQRHSR